MSMRSLDESLFPTVNHGNKKSPTIYNASELSKERAQRRTIRLGGSKAPIRALQKVDTIQNSKRKGRSPKVRSGSKKKSPTEYTYRNHTKTVTSATSKISRSEMPDFKLIKKKKRSRNRQSSPSGGGTTTDPPTTNYIHTNGKTTFKTTVKSPKKSVPGHISLMQSKTPLVRHGKLPAID